MGAVTGDRQLAEEAVRRTIDESALGGERIVAIFRIVFCVALGARSLYYSVWTDVTGGHEFEKALIAIPCLVIAIGFSIAILLGLGRRRTRAVLHISVALDSVISFISLLPNSLWPAPEYRGVPFMMDTAALLLMTTASSLRHYASAAALGAGMNLLSYTGLAIADHVAAAEYIPDHAGPYTMYGILVAVAGALAFVLAIRSRRVVERAARAAIAADQASRGLRSLLRDHHDLRTVISSAQLNVDMLSRDGSRAGAELVAHLKDDLGEIRHQLDHVKGRALEELANLDAMIDVSLHDAATAVVGALRPRFPAVDITTAIEASFCVRIAGGEPSLRRILSNLIANACEGDGAKVARSVELRARSADDRIIVEVADDGPGLPDHVLAAPAGDATSTKAAGTGLGIGLVDGLVRASGGTIAWRNRDGGGAIVELAIPTGAR